MTRYLRIDEIENSSEQVFFIQSTEYKDLKTELEHTYFRTVEKYRNYNEDSDDKFEKIFYPIADCIGKHITINYEESVSSWFRGVYLVSNTKTQLFSDIWMYDPEVKKFMDNVRMCYRTSCKKYKHKGIYIEDIFDRIRSLEDYQEKQFYYFVSLLIFIRHKLYDIVQNVYITTYIPKDAQHELYTSFFKMIFDKITNKNIPNQIIDLRTINLLDM